MALAKGMIEPIIEPLNLDKVLGKPRNRVAKCGVELEGGWLKVPIGVKLDEDYSVFGVNAGKLAPDGYRCGELPLGPILVAQLPSSMRKYYPDLVDSTCGMHIHMSFETTFQYNLLADSPAYQETMQDYLLKWAREEGFPDTHHIWPRLKGQSTFAQKEFWPQEQIQQIRKDHDRKRYGHRYTMIHYCWQRYATVECRVLPMMETYTQAIRAVRRVIDITNAYLILANKHKAKATGRVEMGEKDKNIYDEKGKDYKKVVLDNGDVYEEYIEVKL